MVSSMEFKNLCSRAGYPINNNEVVNIFKKYDRVRANIINYIEVLNDFRAINENRTKQIESFKPYYEKIGIQYMIPKVGIAVGAMVKAHYSKADLTELVVSVPIRLR